MRRTLNLPRAGAPNGTGAYAGLLRHRHGRRVALAALGARLPQGMTGISVLFLLVEREGVRVAGALAAAYTLALGLAVPATGRLVDRFDPGRVVRWSVLAHTAATALLLLAAFGAAPPPVTAAAAALAGATTPPLGPAVRAQWTRLPGAVQRAGFALDAIFLDVCLIAGPVLASALVAVHAALGVCAILLVTWVGAVLLGQLVPSAGAASSTPPAAGGAVLASAGRDRPTGRLGPLRVAAYRRVAGLMVLASCAIAAVAVGLPALAAVRDAPWAAGPLVAAFSVGSILGGLYWGRRGHRAPGGERRAGERTGGLVPPFAALALTLAVLPLVGPHPVALLVAAPVAGLPVAAVLASLAVEAAARAPEGTATEAQSWLVSANTLGSAAAALLVTTLLGHGHPSWALLAPVGLALVAALAAPLLVPGRDAGRPDQ
ncbi:MFS transporter [Micromonospora sp. NPDC049559]|uniref:MFS transporter n=1 Tax=Micromonospora sp. NPDC049559 TaxID=3155923 RepID=UPI003448631F